MVSDAIFDPFLMRGEQPRAYADRAAFDTYCHIIPAADGFCNHPAVFPGPGRDIPGAYSGKPGGKAMQTGAQHLAGHGAVFQHRLDEPLLHAGRGAQQGRMEQHA